MPYPISVRSSAVSRREGRGMATVRAYPPHSPRTGRVAHGMTTITDRIEALDWDALEGSLDVRGFAVTAPLLDPAECRALARRVDGAGVPKTRDKARPPIGAGGERAPARRQTTRRASPPHRRRTAPRRARSR